MADEQTGDAGESTVPGTETGASADVQTSDKTGDNGKGEGAGQEKLLQRIEALQSQFSKVQSEKDKALAKLEVMERFQKDFADTSLSKQQQTSYAEQRKALIEKINQGWDGETAVSLLEKVVLDAEDGATKKMSPKLQALESELAELKRALKEANPDRQKYQQRVAELKAELPDVDDDTLVKIARLEAKKNAMKSTPAPGTTATQRTGGMQSEPELNEEQIAMIKSLYPKATKEELAAVAKSMAAKKGSR